MMFIILDDWFRNPANSDEVYRLLHLKNKDFWEEGEEERVDAEISAGLEELGEDLILDKYRHHEFILGD